MLLSKPHDNDVRVNQERATLQDQFGGVALTYMKRGSWPERLMPLKVLAFWGQQVIREPVGWVIHAHDFDTLPIAIAWARRDPSVRVVFDMHDVPTRGAALMVKLAEDVDRIIIAVPGLRRYLGLLGEEATVIRTFRPRPSGEYSPPPLHHRLRVGFFGGLHPINGVDIILRAAKETSKDVHVVIAGDGPMRWLVEGAASETVAYLGFVTNRDILVEITHCDVLLSLTDPDTRNGRIGLTNKLYEAMAAGRPVIVTGGTAQSDLVEQEHMGWSCPYDPKMLTGLLRYIALHPEECVRRGQNALAAAQRLCWEDESQKLITLYKELMS